MNSRQRVFACARGEAADVFAVTPYNGNSAIYLAGYEISECYTNGKKLAEAQIKTWEKLRQDVVCAQSDQYYIAEGLGVKTQYTPGNLPAVTDVPVKTLKDIEKISPIDPYRDGRCYVYIEAVEHLVEYFGKEVPVRAPGAGPVPPGGAFDGDQRIHNTIGCIGSRGKPG